MLKKNIFINFSKQTFQFTTVILRIDIRLHDACVKNILLNEK